MGAGPGETVGAGPDETLSAGPDEALVVTDEALVVTDEALVVTDEALVVTDEALGRPGGRKLWPVRELSRRARRRSVETRRCRNLGGAFA